MKKLYIYILISFLTPIISSCLYSSDHNIEEIMQEIQFLNDHRQDKDIMQLKSNVKHWEATSTPNEIIESAQSFFAVNGDDRFNIYPEFKDACNKTGQFMLDIVSAQDLDAKNNLIVQNAHDFSLWQAAIAKQRQFADASRK